MGGFTVQAPLGLEICSRCKTTKCFTEFEPLKASATGRRICCRDCRRGRSAKPTGAPASVIVEGRKACAACKKEKPLDDFRNNAALSAGKTSRCRECLSAYERQHRPQWSKPRTEKQREYGRNYYHRKGKYKKFEVLYGITRDQYLALEKEQDGLCALCGEIPNHKHGLVVDHCHTSGKVRALLCGQCNAGLGLFGEDIDRLRAAVAYLETNEVN